MNTHHVPITVLSILHILFHLVQLYRQGKGNSAMLSTLLRVSLLIRGRAGDRMEYQCEVTPALTAKPLMGVKRKNKFTDKMYIWLLLDLIQLIGRVTVSY